MRHHTPDADKQPDTNDETHDHEREDCDYRGRPVPEDTWFSLEVQCPVLTTPGQQRPSSDHLGAILCDQDRAACWLQTPAAPRAHHRAIHPWADRLLLPGLLILAVLVLGLATLSTTAPSSAPSSGMTDGVCSK